MTSALSNFGKMFGGNSIGVGAASAFQNFGNFFGGAQYAPGGAGMFGGMASNLAATPNWAMAGGGIVGGLASKMLFDFDSQAESIGHTVGSAAGAIIGQALIPIPGVGAIIGSFLGGSGGGFLGGLFGGEEKKPKMQANLWQSSGEIQIGDTNDMSAEAVEALQAMVANANAATQAYASALGEGAINAVDSIHGAFAKVPSEMLPERIAFHWADSVLAAVRGAADQAAIDGEGTIAEMYRATADQMSDIIHTKGGFISEGDASEIERLYREVFVEKGIYQLKEAGQEVGPAFESVMKELK
jgi:hypothetical protein